VSLFQLYNVGAEYAAIMQEIEDADGVLTPELEARHDEIVARLATVPGNVKAALEMCKSAQADLDGWIDKLTRRRASLDKEAERWKLLAMRNMDAMNVNRLEGELNGLPVKLALCESESVVVDIDAEHLPDDYVTVKVTRTPDKKKIKAAIIAGEDAVSRVAHIERKPYLRVS